ncbi:MAG: glycerophosphodiester phosphodiesterase [Chloroflexia bacterium]|nr:glycerophosphodiester phosphodiesterase [Chloroflexia bacterium]
MPSIRLTGHRGARGEAPENTLSGFAYAKRLGLTAVEFDVHLSRDGELVVIHDATVDRTTNGSGPVADFTAAELAALDARASVPDWPEPCGVPTLAQVLDIVGGLETLLVEIKRDEPARLERVVPAVLRLLGERGLTDRVIVTSFEPVALELVQHHAPGQTRGYIGAWDGPDFLETALRLGCRSAHVSSRGGSAEMVAACHTAGLGVFGWPCNDEETLHRLLAWGVDGFTTDQPTALRTALDGIAADM